MASVSIQQALEMVSRNPEWPEDDDHINMPVHELVCRHLFDIANRPNANVRGSMARANRARRLIFDRLVGRRRAGTAPATHEKTEVEFIDLTGGPEALK